MTVKVDIDLEELGKLAEMHCTRREIAAFFNVTERYLNKRIKDSPDLLLAIDQGRAKGCLSLRRLQLQEAEAGSIPMLIWLGKNMLGQRDDNKIELNLAQCKTNDERMKRVINAVSKGKLTPKDGSVMTEMIRTLNTEEEIQRNERFKELEKRVNELTEKKSCDNE